MNYFRRASTRSLVLAVLGLLALAAAAAAIAVAAGGGGPTPPPAPLDQAIRDALAAPKPDGVTASVEFTNNLFPSGALLGQTGSALMSGASGPRRCPCVSVAIVQPRFNAPSISRAPV